MLRMTEYIRDTLADKPIRPFHGVILIWNLTNRCNLLCQHCYAGASWQKAEELSLQECEALIPHLVKANVRFAILSGGEPLIRKDIYEIASQLRTCKIATYLSSNGLLISEQNIEQIKASFDYVGISIDGTPDVHDFFRAKQGAFQRSLTAMQLCLEAGIRVGLRYTLTKHTLSSLPFIFGLAEQLHIPKIYISHLVYAGRAQAQTDLSKDDYHRAMQYLLEKAFFFVEHGIQREIVTGNNETDAVLLWQEFAHRYPDKAGNLRERLHQWGGNQAGTRLVNIDAKGFVKPDPFFATPLGNIHQRDFTNIWSDVEANAGLLGHLRQSPRPIEGRCQDCEFLSICNGNSRARAFAFSQPQHYLAEDPACPL